MELSALGIPLEPLRYIWLIAFLLYLVVCVAVDIAYSSTMSKEEARRLHVFYKGSPVDKAMRYAERRSLDGDPLPKHKLRSNLTRARKELDSISGVSKFEAWMHAVMYVWACVIARSIFLLYKDIARDGILLPALVLPFYMVYLGACWSRFIWRSSRYFNLDNHTAGMPQVLGEMLNRIDAFFAPQDAHPQAKPVRSTPRLHLGLCVTVVVALVLAIVVFLYSLVGWTILYTPPMPIGGASIMLAVTAAAALALRWHYLKVYLLFNPIRSTSGGSSCRRRSTVTPILWSSASSRRTPNKSSRPSTNRPNGRSKSRCRPGFRRILPSASRGCAGILWRCTMSGSSASPPRLRSTWNRNAGRTCAPRRSGEARGVLHQRQHCVHLPRVQARQRGT